MYFFIFSTASNVEIPGIAVRNFASTHLDENSGNVQSIKLDYMYIKNAFVNFAAKAVTVC